MAVWLVLLAATAYFAHRERIDPSLADSSLIGRAEPFSQLLLRGAALAAEVAAVLVAARSLLRARDPLLRRSHAAAGAVTVAATALVIGLYWPPLSAYRTDGDFPQRPAPWPDRHADERTQFTRWRQFTARDLAGEPAAARPANVQAVVRAFERAGIALELVGDKPSFAFTAHAAPGTPTLAAEVRVFADAAAARAGLPELRRLVERCSGHDDPYRILRSGNVLANVRSGCDAPALGAAVRRVRAVLASL